MQQSNKLSVAGRKIEGKEIDSCESTRILSCCNCQKNPIYARLRGKWILLIKETKKSKGSWLGSVI